MARLGKDARLFQAPADRHDMLKKGVKNGRNLFCNTCLFVICYACDSCSLLHCNFNNVDQRKEKEMTGGMNMVSFNNRFFSTKEAAKAFQKQNKRGKLITYNAKSRPNFEAEMMVAAQRRGEVVFPEETPYCVAWNEIEKEG